MIRSGSVLTPDGATLGYVALGARSAQRTLVCHPGGPGMAASYLGEMCGIGSDELQVVLVDPRGTGRSSPPADGTYELEGYAADLGHLREHLGVESFDLLGHSHGGFVAMTYALDYPRQLGRLVLVCTAPRISDELRQEATSAFLEHAHRPWYQDSLDAQRRRQTWDFTTSQEAAALYARELRLTFAGDGPIVDAFISAMTEQRPDLAALRYFNERLAPTYDLRPRLSQIQAPTLIINGAADFFGPQVSARELSAIPDSRTVVIPDVGHWPFLEAPKRFRHELETFLQLGTATGRPSIA